jgi:hypothetical protein
MSTLHAPAQHFIETTRPVNKIDSFEDGGITNAEPAQYSRRTAKRPLLCFAAMVAAPFATELICRLMGAW